jgi:hypothetical protein
MPINRPSLSIIVFFAALQLAAAHAAERPGDSRNAIGLQRSMNAAAQLQQRFLALTQSSPREQQFDLYRIYDDAVGTWVQVGVLRGLLHQAMTTDSPSGESRSRTDLRDCARYALWEVDQSVARLDAAIARGGRPEVLRFEKASRALLVKTRPVVARLAVPN